MTERPQLRLEYIDASQLADNPSNWRLHDAAQIDGLKAVLSEVGWAGALLYNERTKRIIDGHARKAVSEGPVPVLIGDWSEREEQIILATLDPLAAMAEANEEALAGLLAEIETDSAAVKAMLDGLAEDNGIDVFQSNQLEQEMNTDSQLGDLEYKIIANCRSEEHQTEVLKLLEEHKIDCKAMII